MDFAQRAKMGIAASDPRAAAIVRDDPRDHPPTRVEVAVLCNDGTERVVAAFDTPVTVRCALRAAARALSLPRHGLELRHGGEVLGGTSELTGGRFTLAHETAP